MRKTNDNGLQLIREFEGTKLRVYRDAIGKPTVGTGHLVLPRDGLKVGDRITDEQAEQFLRDDLAEAEAGVESAITEDITDNQYVACVSLAFNVGVGAFRKSSIVKYINAGDVVLAADRFLLYNKAGGKTLAGLTRRRKAERALFLTDDEPIQNGEVTEEAPKADSTEIIKTTVVEETAEGTETKETTTFEKVTGDETIKKVAKTGMSAVGNRIAAGGLGLGGLGSVLGAIGDKWQWLVGGLMFLLVGAGIWALVYYQRKQIQILTAQINSDKSKNDIAFVKPSEMAARPVK